MIFVDSLLSMIAKGFNLVGDLIYQLFSFLAKPLTYLYYFLDGIFYFFYQLYLIVVKIIMIFVALLQFFGAIVVGFVRSITGMLSIDFDQTPVNYPDASYEGIQVVLDLVAPMGLMDIVPLILIAIVWAYFVKKYIGLLGGEIINNA